MIKKRFNKKRPSWNNSAKEFTGYKKGYEPKEKDFRSPPVFYKVNEEAIKMLKEDVISGPRLSSGMKAHRAATDKLRELDFDPIDALLTQMEQIDGLLAKELAAKAPRVMVINNLVNCKTRILETLLPYRYGKAPVLTVENSDVREPIRIILTTDKEESANGDETKD